MSDYRIIAPVYDWVLYPFMRSISATVATVLGRTDVLPGIDVATSPTEPISAE